MAVVFPRFEHPWIDDSEAPLYILTYPADNEDEELIKRHDEIADWYETVDRPIAWVVDCTGIQKATATQRKIVSEHTDKILPYSKRFNMGTGIVITSSWVRGLLTAIFWLSPPPFPYKIFDTVEHAKAWSRARLNQTR